MGSEMCIRDRWWTFIGDSFVDAGDALEGNWRHELDAANRPTAHTWSGRPDVYHAYQALLLSQHPSGPSLAPRLGGGR